MLSNAALLHDLGISENYKGFYYILSALDLIQEKPERLLLVTKWLYPEIAKRHHTSSACVERDMRSVIQSAWKNYPERIERLARQDLSAPPTVSCLLGWLAHV